MTELSPEPASETAAGWRERFGAPLRAILVGCGSVVLACLLVVGLAAYVISRDPSTARKAQGMLFESLRKETDGRMGPKVDEARRRRFDDSFDRFRRDWEAKAIRESDVDRVRHRLLDAAQSDRLEPVDVDALAGFLDSISRAGRGR